MRSSSDSENAAAERSLVGELAALIALIDLLETGGGDSILKAGTSRTVRCDASDEVRLMDEFVVVSERSRVEGSSVFVFEILIDTKWSGEVFERSRKCSDWRGLDLFHVRDALGGPRANG